MAPPSSARRRTRDELEDDDDDSAASSDASESPKRPRLGSMNKGESSRRTNGYAPNGASSSGLSADEFSPGAIVRVSVENFVTYEKAEFFPGPNLNMVIGPNGTGKSSLVCAICLGLGYGPKHLGRAGSIKEFVKHGKDTATIEIELRKRPKDRANIVIRNQIRREQNTQKWWINGKESSQKNVQSIMLDLQIQVDNLCQFLPQDRVVEFAQCTPVDLLHETLRAAAPQEMTEWQKELQGLHKEKKELGVGVETDADILRNLENRQQGLQADVDRIREREEIQANIENLKAAHLMWSYEEARANLTAAKEQRDTARRSLRRLEQESGPSLEAVTRKREYAQRVGALVPAKMRAVKDAETESNRISSQVNQAAEKVQDFQGRIDAERNGFESKKRELQNVKTKITSLQADLKNRPPEFNAADWNQKIRAEEHTKRELEAERRQLETKISEYKNRGRELNNELKTVSQEIDNFDTQQGQQMSFMKKNFPELAAGWEWIQENQDKFEKEVFGPPMVSCSIKDERYSNQIQALLQNDDFTCFTAQTKNDFKKLTQQLYREMSLSVVIKTCSNSLESFQPPISIAEAERMGLDGFAVDFLDGPAPVLAMLCSERNLHKSGISLREHTDAQYEALVQSGSINSWAAGNQSYIVRRRREYGPQAMTTVTKNIQPGRFWTSQPVDTGEKEELTRKYNELKTTKTEMGIEYTGLCDQRKDIDYKLSELDKKIEQLRSEKNTLQKDYSRWQGLPEKIESEENKKTTCENDMRAIRKAIVDLQYEWDIAAVSRAKAALDYADSLNQIAEAHNALMETRVWHIEAESDIEGLKKRNASVMERIETEKRTLEEASAAVDAAKARGRELGHKVTELIHASDKTDEWRQQLVDSCQGKTAEEIDMERAAEEAKLELIHAANPSVIREFERRALDIERLKRKMEGSQEKLQRLTENVEELMGKWEPKLDELVSKINDAFAYNFEQISCAGEVRVHKDDDFDLWAMDIMVKFRENEELQQLNAHRQSGGERAVSTIFYLMALQSMAQSPFRVVDEINQGMDPRNERMVHERMVEIACREHTSQYFLITPKLLTGLRYDPKMRVLCIASGEHMPREGRKLDFKRCLKIQKGLTAGA